MRAKDSLLPKETRVVNLIHESEFKPSIRTNGIGLPGYQEGWFNLNNGRQGLLFVTDRSQVVYIPTKQGYALLLSPKQPEEFLDMIKNAWNE